MMTLKEVKSHFEHRSFDHRVDFIDEYNFKDEYFDYYKTFIIDNNHFSNHLYLSELIDFAAWLDIFDIVLYDRYFEYLNQKRHYLIKLACLDYIIDSPDFYMDDLAEEKLNAMLSRRNNKLVHNQALMNLLALNKNNVEYLDRLLDSLQHTKDWMSIYRVLNMMEMKSVFSDYKEKIFDFIRELDEEKDYPEVIKSKLTEVLSGTTSSDNVVPRVGYLDLAPEYCKEVFKIK